MKIIILLAATVALALAAPQKGSEAEATIISQDLDQQPDGSYKSSYETSNGIKADETGTLKKPADPQASDVIVAQGSVSYTAPDGTVISLTYVADDEGGFQPQGAHLPTPPPIPPEIQRALEYIAANPPKPSK